MDAAITIVVNGGAAALTYQALAERLGVTKQAIIYWFPTKQDIARALALPSLRAETAATVAAVSGARTATDAIEQFVRALVAHHLSDLPRFATRTCRRNSTSRRRKLLRAFWTKCTKRHRKCMPRWKRRLRPIRTSPQEGAHDALPPRHMAGLGS